MMEVAAIKINIFMMSTNENNITNNNQDDNDKQTLQEDNITTTLRTLQSIPIVQHSVLVFPTAV
jgi:hypothetical protein